jgi:DNA oxidative demethylase
MMVSKPSQSMPSGFIFKPGAIDPQAQDQLVSEVLEGLKGAPLYAPSMPRTGKPMSVRMSNFGPLGWVADVTGYRYQDVHPETGQRWPEMPQILLDLWRAHAGFEGDPEACLVNWYGPGARMGLHVDADEEEGSAPVLSISLGDTALFRIGGLRRSDPTRSLRLASGDLCLLSGESRRAFHGVDRILSGSSIRVPGGGRINLTLRRVTKLRDAEETCQSVKLENRP